MRILITGADGFIAKNLAVRLCELGHTDILGITRDGLADELGKAAAEAEFVFHLAGVNRPKVETEFNTGNVDFTERLCAALATAGRKTPIAFTSSTQAQRGNSYGRSKRAAEEVLLRHQEATGAPVHIFRLTNVFGKWSRPNYNSAVATFSHQVANGMALTINDPAAPLHLVYIDDVVEALMNVSSNPTLDAGFHEVEPVYRTTVGEVALILQRFKESRSSLVIPRVGTGLERALHATYLSFLPPESFAYDVPRRSDARGEFVEMLKTSDSGQLSYFTARPGVTRGEHYHHTKTEKFLVVHGTARFGFRHILTNKSFQIETRGGEGRIVETVPGWAHNVVNIGTDELVVMLWANENFDPANPDTFARKVEL